MKNSLYFQVLAGFIIVIATTLTMVLFGISAFMKDQIIETKQRELMDKGTELALSLQSLQPEEIKTHLSNADYYLNARIWILDQSRQVIAMSMQHMNNDVEDGHGRGRGKGMGMGMGMGHMGEEMGMRGLFSELDAVYRGEILVKTMEQPFYGEKMLIVAVPMQQSDGTIVGAVLLNTPVSGINAMMQRVYYYAGLGGCIALLLGILMASYFARAVVKPLKEMEKATSAMAKGEYNVRIATKGQDEVGRLGESINSLARDLGNYMEEIEKTEKLRRDFIANVSHELRTPLTIMRGYTEGILDGTIEKTEQKTRYIAVIRDETVRLERLVKNLLHLGRLQNETTAFAMEPLPLADITDGVIQMIRSSADKKNITIHWTRDGDLPPICGSGDHITQLVLILLDNALKYTTVGGQIHVELSCDANKKTVALQIQDTGIGIPAADLPYIWERFYKVDKSHSRLESGSGLGLAIAAQIIDRHGAMRIVSSIIDQGTTFVINFPIA